MRAAVAVALAVFAALAAVPAQTPPLAVTADAVPARPFVGQPVALTLRVAWDRAWFAEHAVALLQRRVDVPFHVELPWLDEAGAVLVDAAAGPRVVVGEREVRVVRLEPATRAGRSFERLEVVATWSPAEPGEVVLPPAKVRYAHASAFEATLLGGRQPVDRHEATVASPELTISVRPLPDAGRPAGFSGAVGEFALAVSAPATVEVGDSFTLELIVTGRGNLAGLRAPPWPELPGFAVQGLAERAGQDERRFAFDVLALRAGAALPPIGFPYFAPAAAEYRTASAAQPPLQVVARRPDRPLPERVRRLLAAATAPGYAGIAWYWWAGIAAAIVGPTLLLLGRWRRRR